MTQNTRPEIPPTLGRSASALSSRAAVAVGIVLLLVTILAAAPRIGADFPLSPWESLIVVDADRLARGQPVYLDVPSGGRATHMYGPLATWIHVPISYLVGPTLIGARAISAIAVVMTIAILALCIRSRVGSSYAWLMCGLCAVQAQRCNAIYAEARPDAISLLVALAGLVFTARRNWLGPLLLVAAVYFKQPAATFVGVPIAVWMFRRFFDPSYIARKHDLIFALIPIVLLLIALSLTRWLAPSVWFHMVHVPSSWPMRGDLQAMLMRLMAGNLLLLVPAVALLVARLISRRRRLGHRVDRPIDPLTIWLSVAWMLSTLTGLLAWDKRGGSINSMWPAFAIGTALAVYIGTRIWDQLPDGRRRSIPPAVLLLLLLAVDVLRTPKAAMWIGTARRAHGDPAYKLVIDIARDLPGRVICFDDPTIPLRAGRDAGRSLDAELDAVAQTHFPAPLETEIRQADWIIRVHGAWDAHVDRPMMLSWGFAQEPHEAIRRSRYSLWRRVDASPH